MVAATRKKKSKAPRGRDADALAAQQREISVSEFFAKNRHLLGFDNPRKALLTTIKEAVDNALDACEEAGMLPNIFVGIEPLAETRFRVTVRDNGPGIVRKQVENVFGRLLYGSKFHRMKMSRGQQGIGIAAAGMYGLMTTGKPMIIHTKPHKNKPSHCLTLAIDMQKNKAEVHDEVERHDFPDDTGTEVVIELEAKFQRGRQSVDEYLQQTAIANPHAQIIYQPPDACISKEEQASMPSLIDDYQHATQLAETSSETVTTPGGTVVFPRAVKELPEEPKEIKPHPKGIELGMLLKMVKTTQATQLGGFLQNDFSRVSLRVANEICKRANKILGADDTITNRTWVSKIGHAEAEAIYKAIQEMKLMAPPTDCLSPIGDDVIRAGLLKGIKAEFYTSVTRPPAVYRGNPFQIEIGIAFGGELPKEEPSRVIRFANRVPLLYQRSACCAFKAVQETAWRNYGLSQPKGSVPIGPLTVMVHMASVWVPFTSESKEAIADYDEIRKEMKLAMAECGRKLKTYLNRRAKVRKENERRGIFERYIGEIAQALNTIDPKLKPQTIRDQFEHVAKRFTETADLQFDQDGNPVKVTQKEKKVRKQRDPLAADDSIVIVDRGNGTVLDDDDSSADNGKPSRKSREDDGDYEDGLFD
ncbi:DNA topoisomerase VI subunit B [Planctomycetales bacterium ZRK34]|nr:DNA topoisomerase VI subunit B [Planctomycetales bacterium ZRK34]